MAQPILEAESLTPNVSADYDLPPITGCELIRRGFNDHYLVKAKDRQYVLRLYLNDKYYINGADDFRFELEFLSFLKARDVPVAYPIVRQDGELLGNIETPDGIRYSALFHFAKGQEFEKCPEKTPAIAKQLGELIGRLHLNANNFYSAYNRYHLDFRYLIDEPIRILEKHLVKRGKGDLAFFKPLAAQLKHQVSQLPKESTYGLIHADLHGRNLFYDEEAGFCFFDFDHCAHGWRVYDLATFSHMPDDMRTALYEGYESVRPLSKLEKELMPVFRKFRTTWDLGDMLSMHTVWGKEPEDDYLEECVSRLQNMM